MFFPENYHLLLLSKERNNCMVMELPTEVLKDRSWLSQTYMQTYNKVVTQLLFFFETGTLQPKMVQVKPQLLTTQSTDWLQITALPPQSSGSWHYKCHRAHLQHLSPEFSSLIHTQATIIKPTGPIFQATSIIPYYLGFGCNQTQGELKFWDSPVKQENTLTSFLKHFDTILFTVR